MFRSLALSILAITASLAPAISQGAGTANAFVGSYTGSCSLSIPGGSSLFYSYLKAKIDAKGNVTGTIVSDAKKTLKVTGQLGKITVTGGFLIQSKLSGTFSDGTKWKGTATSLTTSNQPYILGTCSKGAYRGSLQWDRKQ